MFTTINQIDIAMHQTIKYVHTNLIAEDWRKLAGFYQMVFKCTPLLPERDFKGSELEQGTGLPDAHLRGIHLKLPGYGENGPTLEIFNYSRLESRAKTSVNRPGFGHVAFLVDDVRFMHESVIQSGGQAVGEIVTMRIATGDQVTWCYVTDPEGNLIELQSWDKKKS